MENNRTITREDTDVLLLRIFARTIDSLLLFVLGIIITSIGFIIGALTGNIFSGFFVFIGSIIIWSILAFLYSYFLEGWKGQTIGKFAMGIKVVKEDGSPCGFAASLVRNIFLMIDFLPFYFLLGFIVIALTEKRQRIGDRLAGTVVIKKK